MLDPAGLVQHLSADNATVKQDTSLRLPAALAAGDIDNDIDDDIDDDCSHIKLTIDAAPLADALCVTIKLFFP